MVSCHDNNNVLLSHNHTFLLNMHSCLYVQRPLSSSFGVLTLNVMLMSLVIYNGLLSHVSHLLRWQADVWHTLSGWASQENSTRATGVGALACLISMTLVGMSDKCSSNFWVLFRVSERMFTRQVDEQADLQGLHIAVCHPPWFNRAASHISVLSYPSMGPS